MSGLRSVLDSVVALYVWDADSVYHYMHVCVRGSGMCSPQHGSASRPAVCATLLVNWTRVYFRELCVLSVIGNVTQPIQDTKSVSRTCMCVPGAEAYVLPEQISKLADPLPVQTSCIYWTSRISGQSSVRIECVV